MGVQEIPLELWALLLSLMVSCNKCVYMPITKCVGQTLNISCGGPDFMLQILYESYSYSTQDTGPFCDRAQAQCSNAEFLSPVSVGHCNGYHKCSFLVPTGKHISSCDKNSTAVTVYYSCISKSQVFDICSNFVFTNINQLHLITPKFPTNTFQQNRCTCTVIGQNITATVLQHEKQSNSRVIMIFSTDKGTLHINGVNVLNTVLFSQVQKVDLNLVNGYPDQMFKLWIGLEGKNMILKCGRGATPSWSTQRGIKVTSTLSSMEQPAPNESMAISELNTQVSNHTLPFNQQNSESRESQTLIPATTPSFGGETSVSMTPTSLDYWWSTLYKEYVTCTLDSTILSGVPCEDDHFKHIINSDLDSSSHLASSVSLSINKLVTVSSTYKSINSDIQTSYFLPVLLSNNEISIETKYISVKKTITQNNPFPTATEGDITLSSLLSSASTLPDNNFTDTKATDSEESNKTVITVLSCMAGLFFLSLILVVVIVYRRKFKGKNYQMEDIYDAYDDNPALEPDPEPIVVDPRPLNRQPARHIMPLFLINVMWYMLQ